MDTMKTKILEAMKTLIMGNQPQGDPTMTSNSKIGNGGERKQ